MIHLSFEDIILNAADQLIKSNRADSLSLESIAAEAKTSIKKLLLHFDSLDKISLALSKKTITEHEKRSKKIVSLGTQDSFRTLLRHDLKLVYALDQDRIIVEAQGRYKESFALFDDYFENVMPKYYMEIFKKHSSILPDRGMDVRVYAHFVVHSFYFFRKKQLKLLSAQDVDLESTTRQLIASLFELEIK